MLRCMHTFDLQTAAKLEKVRGLGRRKATFLGAVVAFGGNIAVGVVLVVFIVRVFVVFVVVVLIVSRGWMCIEEGPWMGSTGRTAMISLGQESSNAVLVVCVLLEFFVIGIIEHLELLLDGGALAATDGAAARVLLLLLHLAQDGLLFNLDERLALLLAEG